MAHEAAYAACARLAASHYENFPVASRLVPAAMRPHIAAVYAFARVADDFADEDGREPDERYALLDEWGVLLRSAASGNPDVARSSSLRSSLGREPAAIDPALLFEALAHTMRTRDLPAALFEDLLSAFRQDVAVRRYEDWDALLDYCRRSANPVGRLVLRIAGYRDERLDAASDALCTALQLTNFWQDLAIDWRRGRLYVPWSELAAAGAATADLDAGRLTPAWHDALRRSAARTRALFHTGRPVCDAVSGRLRYELRATWLGALRVLDTLEARRFDVFTCRPALGRGDAVAIAAGVITWRRHHRAALQAPIRAAGPSA